MPLLLRVLLRHLLPVLAMLAPLSVVLLPLLLLLEPVLGLVLLPVLVLLRVLVLLAALLVVLLLLLLFLPDQVLAAPKLAPETSGGPPSAPSAAQAQQAGAAPGVQKLPFPARLAGLRRSSPPGLVNAFPILNLSP